jgi:hypothetical protein
MAVTYSTSLSTPVTGKGQESNQPLDAGTLSNLAASNAALGKDEVLDDFWKPIDFDVVRWDKMYPYQLMVVDAHVDPNGQSCYSVHKNAIFTLPLPPESLTRSTPFASQVTVTLGGIYEENNGTPIQILQFRGSMGYLPLRGTFPYNATFSQVNTFTGGVVQGAVSQIAGIAARVSFNIHTDSDFEKDAPISKTTGYYQINKLREFLEQYAAIKKTIKGRNLRLAVCLWKDNEVLLVTPTHFSTTKDVSSPMEPRYSLDFEAWKRIELGVSSNLFNSPTPVRNSASGLARVISTLSTARTILQDIGNVPQSLLGDINHINQVFRQSIGFCKDLAGTIQSFADLPSSVKESIKNKVFQDGADFKEAGKQIATSSSNFKSNILDGTVIARDPGTGTPSRKAVYKQQQDKQLADFTVDKFIPILDQQTKAAINNDVVNTRKLTRSDFETMRDSLVTFSNKMAFLLGAGDSTYALTYGLDNVTPLKPEPTDSDWTFLYALNDSVIALDSLAATGVGEPSEPASLMDAMATLARGSGIAFQVPTSKFAVPFPYGGTLEMLATQYLQDPNRWMEIATLNGLREPYVDETGFDLPLIVGGVENRVLVPFTTNLFVGQRVTIRSNSVTKTVRRITGLKQDLNGSLLVVLDGDLDLNKYKVADTAVLHAFLPDTVNCQSLIYIPSDQDPIENDYLTKDIPTIDTLDPMVMAGGVDLLLDSNKDLIFTEDGDSRLASGLTNIVQNIEIAFSVRQGKLLLHRGFGLPLAVGDSTADVSVGSVVSAVKKMFSNDPTFSKVGQISVKKNGPSLSINASAVVAGSKSFLPLSFGLK